MKIDKYIKNKNGMYTVVIDDNKYKIHEDLILKYDLLLKKEVDDDTLDKILNENINYEAYGIAIKEINKRMRSKLEMRKILSKKNIDACVIDGVVNLLIDQGYLNDYVYVDSYIHDKIVLSSYGPLRIKKELNSLGINDEIIEEKLSCFTEEMEIDRIKKIVDKNIKSNNKSLYMFKMKMKNYLTELGYNYESISSVLDDLSINDDKNRQREYDILYSKYSKKYEGAELEYRIKQALYQKGFRQ